MSLAAALGDKSRFEALDLADVVRFDFVNPHIVDHAATLRKVDKGPRAISKQGVDLLRHGGNPFRGLRAREGITIRRRLMAVLG
jgi:hypothetical protein